VTSRQLVGEFPTIFFDYVSRQIWEDSAAEDPATKFSRTLQRRQRKSSLLGGSPEPPYFLKVGSTKVGPPIHSTTKRLQLTFVNIPIDGSALEPKLPFGIAN
jgi:hypothetical protein